MTDLARKIHDIQIPYGTMRELGLKKNWQKKVSPIFFNKLINLVLKYREMLKELSKH